VASGVASKAGRAIERNWIKRYPSCLGTHSPIEGAELARNGGYRLAHEQLVVRVHPVARQAAHLDVVSDGLSAKFSIRYCVAYTAIHGPPRVRDFAAIDADACDRARLVNVIVDGWLPEFGAVLTVAGNELAAVMCPTGAPARPLAQSQLAGKVADLAGDRLDGLLSSLAAPAARALYAAGLGPSETSLIARQLRPG
jgi:2-methylcitrate dehydratase PrpD